MIERNGDLFSTSARAVAHGVNVDGVMGAGIAVAFRRRWPDMYEAYRLACRTGELAPGGCLPWSTNSLLDFDRLLIGPFERAALTKMVKDTDGSRAGQIRALATGLAEFDDAEVRTLTAAVGSKDVVALTGLREKFVSRASVVDFAPMPNGYAAPLDWNALNDVWDVMVSGKTITNIDLVLNIASQDRPGPHATLGMLDTGAHEAAAAALAAGIDTIALPRIGCGIGGLDYDDVERLLLQVEAEAGIEFEVWTL